MVFYTFPRCFLILKYNVFNSAFDFSDLDAMVEDDRDEGDQQENARRDVQEEVEGSASGQDDGDADPENERAEDQRDLESSDLGMT